MAQVYIERYDSMPCTLRTFVVDGITIEEDVFGDVCLGLEHSEWGNYCIVEFIPHSLEEVKDRINKRCPELGHLTPTEIEDIQKNLPACLTSGNAAGAVKRR